MSPKKKRATTEPRKHGQKKGSYCFLRAPENNCGKENYSSQQAAGRQGRAEFAVAFAAEDSGCALVSCRQRASGAEGKGKGQRWPPLAAPLLLIAALTGPEPARVSVRLHFVVLTSFSCRSVGTGNGAGRAGSRAGRTPRPEPCAGGSAGGEVLPCAEKLPRRLGWRFLYTKPHGPLSSGESFLGVFHASLAVLWKSHRLG